MIKDETCKNNMVSSKNETVVLRMIYKSTLKCSNNSCGGTGRSVKRSEICSRPIPSIGLGRQTTTTYTKPRSILVYSSRIHTCHWLNVQGYWGSIWTPLYHSTNAASMWQREYQVGTTSSRPWQVLHGDSKRKHY